MAKLTRSNNKLIAGVCGGIAAHFGLNANAIRIVFILLLFLTFFSAGIAYLILWAIMPQKNSGESYKERMQNRLNR